MVQLIDSLIDWWLFKHHVDSKGYIDIHTDDAMYITGLQGSEN